LKNSPPVVCLDSNVLVSAIAFGGVPAKLTGLLWQRRFLNVTSPSILHEVRRVLTRKLTLDSGLLSQFMDDLTDASTVVVPAGLIEATGYAPDDMVLETAVLGGCDVLVTGDKRHLLPLKSYRGMVIEPPSQFLKRFG
jgi:putative PIN family toxin of toxin-antitoxin system